MANPAPPLEPLLETLRSHGRPLVQSNMGMRGDAQANFSEWLSWEPRDLAGIDVGTFEHIRDAYMNTFRVDALIRELGAELDRIGVEPSPRATAACINLLSATSATDGAILLYLRRERGFDAHAIGLARTAIEVVGRAVFVAAGTGNEVDRWETGTFQAKEVLRTLDPIVAAARPDATPATRVYEWMCWFGHMNSKAVQRLLKDQVATFYLDAYAAIAYATWACALVGERVIGVNGIAVWPEAWPNPLPWHEP